MQTSNRIIYRVIAIIKYFFLTLALIFVLAVAGINLPFVQRSITTKANNFFIKKQIPVHVEGITLLIDGRIGLIKPEIITGVSDTIVYAGEIKVSVRILPLLLKKIKVENVTIQNAVVNLASDSATGKLNIIAAFSKETKVKNENKQSGKKLQIGFNNVRLRNIRFTFSDKKSGIKVYQYVEKLSLGIEEFSLSDKVIYAEYADLQNVIGGVEILPSAPKTDILKKTPAEWKFKLRRGDLNDIKFSLLQPQDNQRIEFSLGKSKISEAGFELAGKKINVTGLSLEEPGVGVFSSPFETVKKGVGLEASSGFPGPWIISGDNIKISNGFYRTGSFADTSEYVTENPIQRITGISAEMNDLKLSSTESGFTMNGITMALQNGFSLDKGEILFHSDSTRHSTLQSSLLTELSSIHFRIEAEDELSAILRSWKKVPFSLKIDKTEVSSDDIFAFIPSQDEKSIFGRGDKLKLVLNCNISGTADSLDIRELNIRTPVGNSISFRGEAVNIINPGSAWINVEFQAGPLTSSRLNEILKMTGVSYNAPEFEPTSISGRATGSLSELKFLLNMEGLSGIIEAGGYIDLQDKIYDLKMSCRNLDLGRIAGIKDFGRFSGSLDLSGREFLPEKMSLKASFLVDSADYRRYRYHGIYAEVSGEKGKFSYEVKSDDPSMKVGLTGMADLKKSSVKATIAGTFDVNAGKLNLINGISAGGRIEAGIDRSPGILSAFLIINELVAANEYKSESLNNLSVSYLSNDTLVTGKINSDHILADFRFAGSSKDIRDILSRNRSKGFYLIDSTVSNRIPFVSTLPVMMLSVESTYDPLMGLFISDSVFSYNRLKVNMTKDSAGISRADMSVDRFKLGTSSGFATTMIFSSLPDSSYLQLKSDSIRFGNISLARLGADLTAYGDTLLYSLKASSRKDTLLYLITGAAYKDERNISLITRQNEWIVNGYHWQVTPGVFLELEPSEKDFVADLHWKNGEHSIDIYGRKSEKLWLALNKVWLNTLIIPGMNPSGYDGEFTGKIDYLGSDKTELGIQMDIRQIKLAGEMLGSMNITGSFLSDTLGNIESDIKTVLNDTSRLDLSLRYGKISGMKSFSSEFKGIPLNMVESFANKYVRGLEGDVSGNLDLKSEAGNPRLNGQVIFNNTALTVVPLNARFYLNNDAIKMENNQMLFRNFTIRDSLNKQLSVNGGINFKNKGNVTADLQITSDHLQIMNTTSKENPGFNGSVFVDSRLSISGPVQKPLISGSIVLAEGTVVNYKLTENLNVSETEKTITFASLKEDNTGSEKSKKNLISRSPNIEASIEINPNSFFNFEISRGYDIGISITGGGFLNYAVLPNGTISLSGTYEINQGKSELKIPGWPRKDFDITPGSFVKWNGAVDDPELNIETTSKVRGSYYNPVDSKNREVNFIVNMKISNRLSQLVILFDVSSNDQYITSVFSTLSTDERMKQAINLLIFERVELPNMASSSDYVSQQINQFWESQLNQLTKSAIKGVDLSFGIDTYTGAKEGGGEQTYTSFTYEVKKEMFNERGTVMVSGRMNDNSQAGAPTNNMLENFIFEYALDTARTKYLKVYRQQNYEDLLEGEVIKSGIGFIYRKSYNRLRDIWRRQNKKDPKRVNTVNEK